MDKTGNKPARPDLPIRRFDVFAEYSRLEGLKKGMAADEARGYGIWLAKIVAARRFGREKSSGDGQADRGSRAEPRLQGKWRLLGDEPQTDGLFKKEIVDRMGSDFYREVFQPAIQKSFAEGKKYMDVRDSIRSDWKPAPGSKSTK